MSAFRQEMFGPATRANVARRRTAKAPNAPRAVSPRATGPLPALIWLPRLDVPSLANLRGHWAKAKDIKRRQRGRVAYGLLEWAVWPRPPVAVLMTRVYAGRQRPYDVGDNLSMCLKAVKDEVASQYGLDDADARLAFECDQEKGPVPGVRIVIVPVSAGTRAQMIVAAQRATAPA